MISVMSSGNGPDSGERRARRCAGSGLRRRLLTWLLAGAATAVGAAGCAHPPAAFVRPWEREHLARRAMRFDTDLLETRFRQHMWGSREGSDLGYGQPGGGCGCN